MSVIPDGPTRGAVLYADFSEIQTATITGAPLEFGEVRELTSLASKLDGLVMEATPRKLYVFFVQPAAALQLAYRASEIVRQARDRDIARLNLDARVILGHGSVTIEQGRLRSDWAFRLAGLISGVPQNGVAALRDFVAQFQPGEINPPPRPSGRSDLFILPPPAVVNEDQDTRIAGVDLAADRGIYMALTLKVRGTAHVFRSSDCPILIGRDKSCGVQVSGEKASRVHGRVEFEKDKFYYVDDSRNGSYVLTGSGQEILLKREKIALVGEGAISPGAPLSQQAGEVVRFSCQPSRLKMAGEPAVAGATREMRTERK